MCAVRAFGIWCVALLLVVQLHLSPLPLQTGPAQNSPALAHAEIPAALLTAPQKPLIGREDRQIPRGHPVPVLATGGAVWHLPIPLPKPMLWPAVAATAPSRPHRLGWARAPPVFLS